MSALTRHCWHNGDIVEHQLVSPSIASLSLHMGTGVFDGLMAYWNGDHYFFHEIEAHLDRLRIGAGQMGMPVAWTSAQLAEGVRSLLECEMSQTYYIRPIVYRGGPELWLTGAESRPVDVSIFGVPVPRRMRDPIECEISPIERVSSRAMPVKWKVCGLYVNSYLARRGAEKRGAKDGIMVDREGRIAEASAANVFFIKHDCLVTPPLNEDVFPGITRRVVFDLCRKLNVTCIESNLSPGELSAMQGAFLCSTLMELKPVSRVGQVRYDSTNHPLYRSIETAFDALTAQ